MGLTCSVLGHRYGEREHIEERDRQGSEEVVAVREVKTCERCGDELIVSESKEVTAVEDEVAPVEAEPDEAAEPDPEPIEVADADVPPELQTEADDGIILPPSDDDREPGAWPPLETPADEGDADADPIEWPDPGIATAEDEAEADPQPWPDVEGEDEGFDAIPGDDGDDGRVIEAVSAPAEPTTERTDAGFVRAAPIDSPADPDEGDVHAEFFCPQCDWSARSLTTSVRRGDICPSCQTGYIAEREVR